MANSQYTLDKFTPTSALSKAWEVLKGNPTQVGGAFIAYFLLTAIPQQLLQTVIKMPLLGFLTTVALFVWNSFLFLGLIVFMLKLIRGEVTKVEELFQHQDKLLEYIKTSLRLLVMVIPAMIFFVLPGLYVLARFGFALYLVADSKATGGKAFRMSTAMTKDHILTLFFFFLLSFAIVMIGTLLFIIPGLIASTVATLGFSLIYQHLLQHTKISSKV